MGGYYCSMGVRPAARVDSYSPAGVSGAFLSVPGYAHGPPSIPADTKSPVDRARAASSFPCSFSPCQRADLFQVAPPFLIPSLLHCPPTQTLNLGPMGVLALPWVSPRTICKNFNRDIIH
jgi:hypothetical protein